MTPGQSRAFFAAFTVLTVAVAANALRQPSRTAALVVAPADPASRPKTQPATAPDLVAALKQAKPPLAAAPAITTAAATPKAEPPADKKSAVVSETTGIVLGKVSRPVRIEGRLPPATIVGQLPLPGAADADAATVTAIQKALVDTGFGPQIVNGTAGPLTRAGIMAFEFEHDLALTGEASERLLRRLKGDHTPSAKRSTDARHVTTQEAEQVVLIVQKWLQTLGYGAGKIDGRISPDTQSAIRIFEADAKVAPTGRISADLFSRLARTVGARTSADATSTTE